MSKKMNTATIVNELKGNSGFFQPSTQAQDIFNQADRTEIRTEKRSVSRPQKRLTRRYSFEFYDDQLDQIRQIKYEALLDGTRLSMSEIVRDALDQYFQTLKK